MAQSDVLRSYRNIQKDDVSRPMTYHNHVILYYYLILMRLDKITSTFSGKQKAHSTVPVPTPLSATPPNNRYKPPAPIIHLQNSNHKAYVFSGKQTCVSCHLHHLRSLIVPVLLSAIKAQGLSDSLAKHECYWQVVMCTRTHAIEAVLVSSVMPKCGGKMGGQNHVIFHMAGVARQENWTCFNSLN